MRHSRKVAACVAAIISRGSTAGLCSVFSLGVTLAAPPAEARSITYQLDIPAQGLNDSLQALALVSHYRLLYSSQLVDGRSAPALKGEFSAEEAIRHLLSGTTLSYEVTGDGLVLIRADDAVPTSALRPLGIMRLAQSAPADTAPPESLANTADLVQEVLVTGSRIQRTTTSMETPTPVTAVTVEEIRDTAPTTLMDALALLPQFANNNTAVGTSDGLSGAVGTSNLNLRGIGPSRTLVLLDGRRVVPSTRRGSVDISLFPEALLQRVEVVTGGASAAYGSDAVSGVANFILDTNFTGLKASLQGGVTSRNDNEHHKASIAGGMDIGERMHLIGGIDHFVSDGIKGYSSRDWFQSWGNIRNPNPNGPTEILVSGINYRAYTLGGVITSGPLAGTQFLEGGVPAPFFAGDTVSTFYQHGGSGYDEAEVSTWILPDQKRTSGFGHLTYELNDKLDLFGQAIVGNSKVAMDGTPSAMYISSLATIYPENAFLPQTIRQRMIDQNIPSFQLARMSPDIGVPWMENESRMLSLTTGVKGDIGRWKFDSYYQYGRNKEERSFYDVARTDRLWRSVDSLIDPVSGRAMCRSTLMFPTDGCVPLNLFGPGAPSQEARDYLLTDFAADQHVTQQVAEASLSGNLVEGWAGPFAVATGASYRKETFDLTVSPADLAALRLEPAAQYNYRGIPARDIGSGIFERTSYWNDQAGEYDVWEAFGEALVPLLRDVPLVKSMNLDLASRYASYSGSGGVWAWKAGLDWELTEDVRLRGTRSRDVRAGNLMERFNTSISGGAFDRDPLNPGAATHAIWQIDGGNPEIAPETAETLTYGIVYKPSWLSNFSAAVDYYDIRVNDAISQLGVQNILDQCAAGAQQLCDVITRDPATNRLIRVVNVYLNVAEARTRGIDIELAYRTPISLFGGNEALTVRGFANHIMELSSTNFGAAKVDRAGQTGRGFAAPSWRANLNVSYTNGPFSMFVQERFIGSGKRDATHIEGVHIDNNRVSSWWYTTLGLTWSQKWRNARFELFGTVNNLFDRNPSAAPTATPYSTNHTNEDVFDPLGRRYTLGIRMAL